MAETKRVEPKNVKIWFYEYWQLAEKLCINYLLF